MQTKDKSQLWESLAQLTLPKRKQLYDLSGILDEDIHAFQLHWELLPIEVKVELISTLRDITEADYAVDFTAVFNIALDENNPGIRIAAMQGLAECEDIRLIPRYCKLLQTDSHVGVRAAAAQALAPYVLLGELGKIHEKHLDKIMFTLIAAIQNTEENVEVKRRALEAAAYTGMYGVPDMIETAYTSPELKMIVSAIFSMGRSAEKRWEQIVKKELGNINPEIRFEATRACGELQLRDTLKEMIELTDDVDPQVQEMAIWSLGQIGGRRARQVLEQLAKSDSDALNTAAKEALDELDFYEEKPDSFLGIPSEFDGEGESSWFSPLGYMRNPEFDSDTDDEE